MGYSLSWVAVRGRSSESVRTELKLEPTGATEEVAESPLVGANLAGGWTLVMADHDARFVDDDVLRRLSRGAEAVACFVEEHVMTSCAMGWRDGRQIWRVDHDGSGGPTATVAEGELPDAYARIHADLGTQQGGADVLFDAPVELAREVTGYRHDTSEDLVYEVLRDVQAPAKRSLLSRLFGGMRRHEAGGYGRRR